jgi:hypothetical protein
MLVRSRSGAGNDARTSSALHGAPGTGAAHVVHLQGFVVLVVVQATVQEPVGCEPAIHAGLDVM